MSIVHNTRKHGLVHMQPASVCGSVCGAICVKTFSDTYSWIILSILYIGVYLPWHIYEGRKEVFPWTVIGLLFLLWTVNCVLFSSWTVNWPPLIFSVIRELSFIFFVNRELESFIFPVIRDWPLFFFREPWILPIIFVNFPIFPPKSKCHLSLWSVTGSSWST